VASVQESVATSPVVAVFDLDGTLVPRATVARFAHELTGTGGALRGLARGLLAMALRRRRSQLKVAALDRVLRGRPLAAVRAEGHRFARRLLRRHVDPAMADRLRSHRRQGHHLVLLTGALDVYAEHVGDELGIDAVVATRVVANRHGHCTGQLLDARLVGNTKARALERHLQRVGIDPESCIIHAYSDSRADRPFLRWARQLPRPEPPSPGPGGARG
jgi:HAD superfamily hydrolase (TIGR01490 family)